MGAEGDQQDEGDWHAEHDHKDRAHDRTLSAIEIATYPERAMPRLVQNNAYRPRRFMAGA